MSKLIGASIIAMAALLVFVPAEARADCAQDIKAVQQDLSGKSGISPRKSDGIAKLLEKARDMDAKGKRKACAKLVAMAKEKLTAANVRMGR